MKMNQSIRNQNDPVVDIRNVQQSLEFFVAHLRKPYVGLWYTTENPFRDVASSVDRNFGDSGSELIHPYIRFA
jgi:hypothetical protein